MGQAVQLGTEVIAGWEGEKGIGNALWRGERRLKSRRCAVLRQTSMQQQQARGTGGGLAKARAMKGFQGAVSGGGGHLGGRQKAA